MIIMDGATPLYSTFFNELVRNYFDMLVDYSSRQIEHGNKVIIFIKHIQSVVIEPKMVLRFLFRFISSQTQLNQNGINIIFLNGANQNCNIKMAFSPSDNNCFAFKINKSGYNKIALSPDFPFSYVQDLFKSRLKDLKAKISI